MQLLKITNLRVREVKERREAMMFSSFLGGYFVMNSFEIAKKKDQKNQKKKNGGKKME